MSDLYCRPPPGGDHHVWTHGKPSCFPPLESSKFQTFILLFGSFSVDNKSLTTFFSLDVSGEGAAAGKRAGTGASPPGGAEEETLRARRLRKLCRQCRG